MIYTPAARLDEPIIGGIKAIDQEQQHRPDQKVSEGDNHRRHDEMAFGQARGDDGDRRDLVDGWRLLHRKLYVQIVQAVQLLRSVQSPMSVLPHVAGEDEGGGLSDLTS